MEIELDLEKLLALFQGQPVQLPDGSKGDILLIHKDAKLVNLEQFKDVPDSIRQLVKCATPDAFQKLVERFADTGKEQLAVFSDPLKGFFRAILDYHEDAENPHWGRNVIELQAVFSPEYAKWRKVSDVLVNQHQLAEFIEDSSADFSIPSGAAMLEIALALDVQQNVAYKAARRLETGDIELTFNTETTAQTKGVSTRVPTFVYLNIPVYYGKDPQRIQLRFKYQLEQGKLALGFQIIGKEQLEYDAGKAYMKDLQENLEGVPFFEATQEAKSSVRD